MTTLTVILMVESTMLSLLLAMDQRMVLITGWLRTHGEHVGVKQDILGSKEEAL